MVYSNWRQELTEVMTDKDDNKKVTEKNIKNKIKINPTLGEAIEAMGGELIDMVEMMDPQQEKEKQDPKEKRISQVKKQVLMKKMQAVRQGAGADIVAHYEPEGEQIEEKKGCSHTHEGEECPVHGKKECPNTVAAKVDEAVYGGTPEKKKDTRMTVTAADKKANTPAYQKFKAGDKRYKAADHMEEGKGDPCWDTHEMKGMKKKGNRMVPNCVPKNEEVEVSEEGSMSPQEIALQKRKATIDQMIARKRKQSLDKGQSEQPAKAMGEEASDAMKDRRMERGGVGGNQRYDRAPKASNTAGKKKKYDGMSALDFVKAEIRAKHGKGAIMDTKKK